VFSVAPFTAVFNCTGQPAISLPLARSEAGLPIGMQFAAAYGREDLLLALAAVFEQAMPWPATAPQPVAR
jgi:amidase